MENKSFEDLYNKNVSEFVEKKGKFNYLSWAFAVKELKKAYPEATYIQVYNENKPYFQDESGCYIKIKLFLTKDDRKNDFYQDFTHPILDNQNKSINKPNSFQVNTSFMRGLTKLIGMCTGIGLSLYSGEDLPDIETNNQKELREIKEQLEQGRDKALEKAKVWNEFYEKMKETLSNKTFKSVSEYVEFIEITYLKKSPSLKENQAFKGIFEAFMPKPEITENKAKQSVNKFDKCNECKNETEFCICDIDKKAPVFKPSGSWAV